MILNDRKRDSVVLIVLGVVFAFGYGFLPINFGEITLSSSDAWNRGIAQPYVISGVVLIGLAWIHYLGHAWVRWAILIWCPVAILGGSAWANFRGVGSFDFTFLVAAAGIVAIWFWGISRMLFVRAKVNYS